MAKKTPSIDPIAWCARAASEEKYRPVLCGVHRDEEDPSIFVATNTHQMYVVQVTHDAPLETVWQPGQRRVLNPKLKVTDSDVNNGTYPNWRRVMPFNLDGSHNSKNAEEIAAGKGRYTEFTFDAGRMAHVLNCMKTAAKQNANRVRFRFETDGTLVLTVTDPFNHDTLTYSLPKFGKLTLTGENADTEIAFCVEYLLDALKGTIGEVTMRFYANSRAAQLNFNAHPGCVAVIMPMALY